MKKIFCSIDIIKKSSKVYIMLKNLFWEILYGKAHTKY